MINDFIKENWEQQALNYGESHWASWGDKYAIELEIETISNFIKEGFDVLDVGCANGYSTLKQLIKKPRSIVGIDFSETMIENARLVSKNIDCNKLSFKVGDVRKLDFNDETFDLIYTTRVLINLCNWDEQQHSIKECIRVAKKGGTIILSEAFWEPLVLLNAIRIIKQLKPLVEHDFNRYLKKEKLSAFLDQLEIKYEIIDFSSIYYLGSRFIREFATNVNDYPGYSNPINEIFYNIEKQFSGGGFGIQQAYIIYK